MSIMKEEFYPSRESFPVPKGRSYVKRMDQGFVLLIQKLIQYSPYVLYMYLNYRMNIKRDMGFIHYREAGLARINKCTAPPSNKK